MERFDRYQLIIKERRKELIDRFIVFQLVKKLIFLFLILYILLTRIFGIKIMPNRDMYPRLSPSDLLFYYRLDKDYKTDDLLIVSKEDKEYVLRLVALPGDKINIDQEGFMINDAHQANENIYYKTLAYQSDIEFPLILEEDEYFLLGDLREGAMDSRYFGPVKRKNIKGKIFTILRRTNF